MALLRPESACSRRVQCRALGWSALVLGLTYLLLPAPMLDPSLASHALLALLVVALAIRGAVYGLVKRPPFSERVLILGDSALAADLARQIRTRPDLALRLVGAGHEIIYTPFARVAHLVETSVRLSSPIFYTFTRNAIWVALRNHRPGTVAISLAQDLALMAVCAARSGQFGAFARGLSDGLRGARRALRTRRPLSAEAYCRRRAINTLRPRPARRALRHARERLI